jgi:hypothetical protein
MQFKELYLYCVGRDSSVGIATRYWIVCLEVESRCGRGFRTRPDQPWGPLSLLYRWYRVKPPGSGADTHHI